jgi:hypothetical protein
MPAPTQPPQPVPAPGTPLARNAKIEVEEMGGEQSGALLDRIKVAEVAFLGSEGSGVVDTRLLNLEESLGIGRRVVEYPNGDKYDGEWKDGNKHGRGVMTFADGAKYLVEWENGRKRRRLG